MSTSPKYYIVEASALPEAAVGGLAFVASDALVCKGLIISVGKSHHWITMGLYYGAQLFFAMAAAVGLK